LLILVMGCSNFGARSSQNSTPSDEIPEQYVLKSAPSFTEMRLLPRARVAIFRESATDKKKSIAGSAFMRGGGPMYVGYFAAGLAGGDQEHILLRSDSDPSRRWFNEEIAPR